MKRAHRAEQRRRGPVALRLEPDDREHICQDEQHGGPYRECKRAVETIGLVAVEDRAAPAATGRTAWRQHNFPLQQVTFVTCDEARHGSPTFTWTLRHGVLLTCTCHQPAAP